MDDKNEENSTSGVNKTGPNYSTSQPTSQPLFGQTFSAQTSSSSSSSSLFSTSTKFSFSGGSESNTNPSQIFASPSSFSFANSNPTSFGLTNRTFAPSQNLFGSIFTSTSGSTTSFFASPTSTTTTSTGFLGSKNASKNYFAGSNLVKSTASNMFGGRETNNKTGTTRKSSAATTTTTTSATKQTASSSSSTASESKIRRPQISRAAAVASAGLFGHALAGLTQTRQKEVSKSAAKAKEERSWTNPIEDTSHLKALMCKGIRKELNCDEFLRRHFSQFGKVTKLNRYCAKESAVVHFETNAEAALAKEKGTILTPGENPVGLFWSSSSASASSRKKQVIQEKTASNQKSKLRSVKVEDPEVEDELRSMMNNTRESDELVYSTRAHGVVSKKRDEVSTATKTTTSSSSTEQQQQQKFKQDINELLRIQAKTTKERFQLLERRDKLLRLNRVKQSNIRTATAVVGTCPDMCPEKERYLREDGGRLPYFEMSTVKSFDNQEINHKAAIKEYSRSSADQEEPLPHELRPVTVLSMTMDFLMCNVMDKFEQLENPAEWYDFVWNRTRAIRKDLTQQHLCDLNSVTLVEKCARFHIHCSERLCEEEMSCFDQKINNENLTKCMQTLKHFYHDLALKNVKCPCEAEFRGYDILLNLNLADTLRQVQTLTVDVRNSLSVNFALKMFTALNNNNFVRFFKLVRSATYLNACILHRYFNQVRTKALFVMTRAYSPPSHRPAAFPIEEFIQKLGFEDESEAREFCALHGILVERNGVIFDRTKFFEPESIPSPKRAQKLIESKRNDLVGVVVNGGHLPANPAETYQPHSSFDENGFLKEEAILAQEQQRSAESDLDVGIQSSTVKSTREVESEPTVRQSDSNDLMEIVNNLADESFEMILEDILNAEATEIVEGIFSRYNIYMKCVSDTFESIYNEFFKILLRDVSIEVIKGEIDELKRLEDVRKKEEGEICIRAVFTLANDFSNNIVDELMQEAAQEVVNAEENELRKRQVDGLSNQILEEILLDISKEEIKQICLEVFKIDVKEKLEKLRELSYRIRLRKTHRWFLLWRRNVIILRRKRRNLKEFPSIPGISKYKLLVEPQIPRVDFTLPMERLKKQKMLNYNLETAVRIKGLRENITTMFVDIASLVAPILFSSVDEIQLKKWTNSICWKLVISLSEQDQSAEINEWLRQKFRSENLKKKANGKVEVLNVSKVQSDDFSLSCGICVVSTFGNLTDQHETKHDLKGTNAILFLIRKENIININDFWYENKLRLNQLLNRCKGKPAPTLLILLLASSNKCYEIDCLTEILQLKQILQMGFVSNYEIFYSKDVKSAETSLQMLKCLKTAAKRMNYPRGLHKRYLPQFLDDIVTKFFCVPAYDNYSDRHKKGLLHQSPQILISLYNAVLMHAAKTVASNKVKQLSWPPVEFVQEKMFNDLPSVDWNSDESLKAIDNKILSLQMPDFKKMDEETSWEEVVQLLKGYVRLFGRNEKHSSALKSKIAELLSKCERDFSRDCSVKFRIGGCQPSAVDVPWTDVIVAFAEHKFASAELDKPETFVYYFEDEFNCFDFSRQWRKISADYEEKESTNRFQSLQRSAIKRKYDLTFTESNIVPRKRCETAPPVFISRTQQLLDRTNVLLSRIQTEKNISEELEMNVSQLSTSVFSSSFPNVTLINEETKRNEDVEHLSPEEKFLNETLTQCKKENLNDKLKRLQMNVASELQKEKIFDIRMKMLST